MEQTDRIDKVNSFVRTFRRNNGFLGFLFPIKRRTKEEILDLLVTAELANNKSSAIMILENELLRQEAPEHLRTQRGIMDMQAKGMRYSHKDTDYVELRKMETKRREVMYELYLSRAGLY